MSELKEATKEITEKIDNVAGFVEAGVDLIFSPVSEDAVLRAEKSMKKCKKVCKAIGIIVLAICAVIVYFHLKG